MRISSFVAAFVALATTATVAKCQQAKPIVHVVGTGGTIGSGAGYWTGNTQRISIDDLLKIPGLDSIATLDGEQYLNTASMSIGPDRWLDLSRRITDLFRTRPELAGIVVTHGTDTMEETAYFLDLTIGGEKPVVVTGSMRPSNMAGADGPANLTSAVRAAVSHDARGRGTLVVMDDRAFAARDVTKTNSTRVETFQAPERGPLATIDPERLYFRAPAAPRNTAQFDITNVKELPRVDIVYAYPGADSVAVDALVNAGAKGIVVASAGRGAISAGQSAGLRRASEKGVVVVIATRTGSGRVPVGSNDSRIGAGDLNAQKARVLLMLALTQSNEVAHVRRIFDTNQ